MAVPDRPEIKRGTIDGVTAFWPVKPAPGPLRATLQFRVGRADEPLPMAGVTHLVEHLAFHGLDELDHAHNGFVEMHRTAFYGSGTPDEMREFLANVTAGIGNLDCGRIEAERGVLRVEAQSRGNSLLNNILAFRYGAVGIGTVGFEEFGLRWLEEEHVKDWASRWFTKENAVLWLSAKPPLRGANTLKLHLPEGDGTGRKPLAESAPIEIGVPALLRSGSNAVAFGFRITADGSSSALMRIAERRLLTQLRREGGMAYQVAAVPQVVDRGHGEVLLAADTQPEQAGDAMRIALDVFEDLATSGVTDKELERDAHLLAKALSDENAVFGWLDDYARRALVDDAEPLTPQQLVDEILAVDKQQLAAQMSSALDEVVAVLPDAATAPDWRWAPETWSKSPVSGRPHSTKVPQSHTQLIVGDDGVSLVYDPQRIVTVRWDDCVVLPWWEDGGRALIGRDGFHVYVNPWTWATGDHVIKLIDAAVPPGDERRVPMGPGEGPPASPPHASAMTPRSRRMAWAAWAGLSLLFVAVFFSTAPHPDFTEVDVADRHLLPIDSDGVICGTDSNFTAVFGDFTPPAAPGHVEEVKRACREDASQNLFIGGVAGASLLAALAAPLVQWLRRRRRVNAPSSSK